MFWNQRPKLSRTLASKELLNHNDERLGREHGTLSAECFDVDLQQ